MKLCPQCETGYADSHITCPAHGVMLGEIRELRPGMLIRNTYRIIRKLGQGGMGAVYLAEHTLMRERQALKFLSAELSHDETFTSRFLREVRTLRQIRHRNVVDAGNLEPAEDGTLFFSMEFVDGPDLRDFLESAPKPLDVKLALEITRGIAEGLAAAHAQGMVHRDIKPENILLARNGDGWTPKIADFGIVATKEDSGLYTRTGGTLLTMAYAAPEQWRGMKASDLDGRTDLYALGGLLYEMLTGVTAFEAENYEGWAEQHRFAVPRPPASLRPELAGWSGLDEFILGLLAKDREGRPLNVVETIGALESIRFVPPRRGMATALEYPTGSASARSEVGHARLKRVPSSTWIFSALFLLSAAFAVGRILVTRGAVQPPYTSVEPAANQGTGVSNMHASKGAEAAPSTARKGSLTQPKRASTEVTKSGGGKDDGRIAPSPRVAVDSSPAEKVPSPAEEGARAMDLYKRKQFVEAVSLFANACSRGAGDSCNTLGAMYDLGDGVALDHGRAAQLYNTSCGLGFAEGCENLASLYAEGAGVGQDKKLARQLYAKACFMGDQSACRLMD
jgi:serine/threonine protein kinase